MPNLLITGGGYVIGVIMLFLLLNAREDIGEIREQCNTRTAEAVAEAERVSRETLQAAHLKQIERLRQRADQEAKAKDQAEQAWLDAEKDKQAAQAEIDRLIAEAGNPDAPLETKCLAVTVPSDIRDSL